MESRTRSFKLGIFLALLTLLIIVPVLKITFFAISPLDADSKQEVFIEVNKGQNPKDVAKLLLSNGVISEDKNFIWLGRLTRQWKKIKAGEYKVSPSMSPIEVFSVITSGISVAHPITVREGENMYEIAEDLEAKGLSNKDRFLNLCKNALFIASITSFKGKAPPTLEGYLFPDTYFFNRTMTDEDMIKQMLRRFFSTWGQSEEKRAQELNMTQHEIITLASIIEKETGAPEERPIISSVFHNRLQKGMKLQSDPTTIYGIWDRYDGKIRKSDLSTKNDYNTYHVKALPIGPIGNPGKEAIHSALYPSTSTYLYFVSHNDGTHQFSRTIQEHNYAVKIYQLDPRARAGKSWRDHLKKPASSIK